ncbi:MAG TPA: aspartate/glutamate racemase family protein [Thermoanaerobaculia bacterium]|jgi:aspartate racemase
MTRTIGIIGGIAPESTIDYYRRLVAACRERAGDGSYPSILINSIDLTKTYVHDTYMNDLVAGRFEPHTRDCFVEIMRGLRERESIDGVVLAGTELPLLLRDTDVGIEMLDTTALHVAAIVERVFA